MKKIKSPLRYPGGKSKAIKKIQRYYPKDLSKIREIREPFCGGASFTLDMKQKYPEKSYWINDSNYYLYNFWYLLKNDPYVLTKTVFNIKESLGDSVEKHKEFFLKAKEELYDGKTTLLQKAVYYFILNRSSYGGLTEVGSFSKTAALERFTFSSIEKMAGISDVLQGIKITNLDFEQVMEEPSESCFVFLDPPYNILKTKSDHLYKNHHAFDNERFFSSLDSCEHKWLLTYNDEKAAKKRLSSFNQIDQSFQYSFHHRKKRTKNELIVYNYNDIMEGEK